MPDASDPIDARRLSALRSYELLDTQPDPELDKLVELAGKLLGTASAAVSLVDADRQWFKARYGVAATETTLDESLCSLTIRESDGLLIIGDTRRDPRVADHGAITGPLQIGFYAGAALETSAGERLGALCVFDGAPRAFSEEQARTLRLLAREVMTRLELHKEVQRCRVVETRLAEVQRLAELGSWELDLESGRLSWSHEVFRQFDLEPTTFGATYEAFLELVHPDDRSLMDAAQARVLAGSEPLDLTHRIVRVDGSIRTVHQRGELVCDKQGRPLRVVATVQDVTSRTAAESRWRELFESAPRPMWVYDIETLRFLAVNDAAVVIYGWSREEFLAMDLTAIRPPEARRMLERSVADETATFQRSGVWWHRWKDGSEREVEITSHETAWHGRAARLVLADDVTDRKRADRQLLALNEQLRSQAALLDLATDAILVHDLDGHVTYWNGGAERTFGFSAAEALGQPVRELLGFQETAFASSMKAVLADGAWRGELRGRSCRGDEVTVEVSQTIVQQSATDTRMVLTILTDVTAQRKLEAQFLRAQRLESIGTLASGIAHDLNNMLSPILMSIELLADEVRSSAGRELLDTIDVSARRGADLVRQVLTFGRGVQGDRIAVSVPAVINSIERMLRDTLPRSVDMQVACPDELPAVVGDATQLHQVLLNLCVNARDAMPNGGTLRVQATTVRIDAQYAAMAPGVTEGPFVCIDVVDTGVGIPQEVFDRIFDPFFTTKPLGEGTGLGLATVQGIARSHGGFVNVYSEIGKGTTFRVYLPAHDHAATRGRVVAGAGLPRGQDELVLVADDEAAIRAITRQTLETFGYRVLVAADGVEAMELYSQRRQEIAIVLTDMRMPRLDGPGLIKAILQLDASARIVAASGLGANGGVAKAAGHGVTHFLPKPYTADALLRKLAEMFGRS